MARIALLSGTYNSRAVINSVQRCVNLFPETTPRETGPPTPVVHRLTPGLTRVSNPGAATWRVLYRATNGILYGVLGVSIYRIASNWALTLLGTIGNNPAPCSMSDNGIVVVLVNGSAGDWRVWPLATDVVTTPVDPAFYGADRVRFLDGFFVFNRPNTNQFYLSPPFWNGVDPFDATYIASKTGGPDPIVTIAVIHANLWLIGSTTSEVWYNSGAADFPFARQPGVFVDHGTVGPYASWETDVSVFFLGRDNAGNGIILKGGADYQAIRISNHALEDAMQGYSTINDARFLIYQQGGHTFVVVQFPTADKTWAYDLATGQWHERESSGARWRVACTAFAYDKVVAGDHTNGKLYNISPTVYTEDGSAITRLRSFPHVVKDGKRFEHQSFTADLFVDGSAAAAASTISLDYSDDRGVTYGTAVSVSLAGFTPAGLRSLIWRRLGQSRDRVYRLTWNYPYEASLQGAWLDAAPAET